MTGQPRRPDQRFIPPAQSAVAAGSVNHVNANGPAYLSDKNGMFIYTEPKGLGRLIGYVTGQGADVPTVDPYGNPLNLLGGFVSQNTPSTSFVIVGPIGSGITCAKTGGLELAPTIVMTDSTLSVANYVEVACTYVLTPLVRATQPGTSQVEETWQTLSLAAGPAWTATYARYAAMPFGVTAGMVWVNACLTSGTTVADGTIIATIAAGWTPAANIQGVDMMSNDEPPNGGQTQHLEVDTSGNVRCYGVAATGKVYYINAAYPLD